MFITNVLQLWDFLIRLFEMLELVEFDIPELLNVYLKFENEEMSPVGVLKRGGLKRVANGDLTLRKTSSLPVRSDRTVKEFGELKLISGDPVIEKLELLKFGVWAVWHLKQIQT